jgi:hypothetical protein
VGAVGACTAALPVWGTGLAVAYGHRLLRRRAARGWGWLPPVCLAGAAVDGLLATGVVGLSPWGLLELSRTAGEALVTGAAAADVAAWLGAYAGGAWPYALAWGPAAGAALVVADRFVRFGSAAIPEGEESRTELKVRDAAKLRDEAVAWGVPDVVGRNVISLLSAPPGGGKGWWLWGLTRAMQDGALFFGLPANRMKLLWCTEEGTSFARTRERFGVDTGLVEVLHRHEVRGWAWPELVREVRKVAWRKRCAIVVFDTIRAWCPEAEKSPEAANTIMTQVRQELTGPGLGALFVHHDTKAGGTFGAGVSGTYGLVGAVDVLIELKRVSDDPTDARRRMVTSRRFEPLDLTARLEGHRYVLLPGEGQKLAARAAVREAVHQGALTPASAQPCARCGKPAAEWHHASYAPGDELAVEPLCLACHQPETADPAATVRETVATVRDADGAMTTEQFITAMGIAKSTASDRLKAAEAAGLLKREGQGGRSGPQVWRLVDPTP